MELDGYMESWVGLVFIYAAYWRLQQNYEEYVLAHAERQAKLVESI